ncbi:hypothetical protein C9J21_04795 [Photobacterium phosphoreum]|uniref:Uncharacterized protein n=1 Tax=Photobacterium phosphoreum TaxID=659 RepID=A0A2T3PNY4_PHOPO|nr:hypothetical protein [Photobacterium phosphoreum]PSU25691.1 hypothetical protein CTM96_08240 [Photobacterium phosphoreum]PSU43507.1 hypothetical protein CTM97_03890 [Photobacterium phosphoreum]PSU53760.1 hypothetical protein C9J18_04985 [Photobacterium phosphoreum]PSU72411.1 hypothetical protein C9J22_00150 [Photobacterium phosphoreum]PSU74941.1 hypothetical protein CTM67_17170 [Photobacterium phosphoreum]
MFKQSTKINIVSTGIGILILPWLPLLISQHSLLKMITDAIGGIAFALAWGVGLPAVVSYGVAVMILLAPMALAFYWIKHTLTTIAKS